MAFDGDPRLFDSRAQAASADARAPIRAPQDGGVLVIRSVVTMLATLYVGCAGIALCLSLLGALTAS